MKLEEPEWLSDYARGVPGFKSYTPESPDARGMKELKAIWDVILPDLERRDVAVAPPTVPKDVSKWAVMPDWVRLLRLYPHKGRNVFKWMDTWLPKGGHSFRSGAAHMVRRRDRKTARLKQEGQGVNDPTPAFTFHGERVDFKNVGKMIRNWISVNKSEYADQFHYQEDISSMDKWDAVTGGRCGTYVWAEASTLFHGMTPHQETDAPIPKDIMSETWREVLAAQFPGYGPGMSTLSPSHLFVGTRLGGGITIGNSDGSGGYPYTNMDQDQVRDVLNRPKFKGRATKGVVFPHAIKVIAEWVKGGMPMKGPLYEAMAQPCTLSYRGDRAVHLGVRALASRSQLQTDHLAADRLAAMLPGRSIIIVSTCLVLAQSMFAQPLGNYIAAAGTPGFDWVDPWHTSKRLEDIKTIDLQQGASAVPVATVGADASGWDRDVVGQFIASDTAWYMSMFPQNVELLYASSPLPMDVTKEWVASRTAELTTGGQGEHAVTGILPDGSTQVQTVQTELLRFDMWEYISKVMTMINDSPLAWGDYEIDAPGIAYPLGTFDPKFEGYTVVSNGGRRTGDAATGIGNSWANLVVTPCAAKMSSEGKLSSLVRRRAALQGGSAGPPYEIIDLLSRGDDLAVAIRLPKGGIPSHAVASGIQSVGMRAHPDKQEASDIPGIPKFSFANVLVTEKYMGKLMGRTAQRYLVQESPGINLEMITAIREAGNDTGLSDALLATTSTAKARIAPLAGFPLMDTHPLASPFVEWAVHNDKFRLSYVTEKSFDDSGRVTEEARTLMRKAAAVEARAQAKLRARRETVNVDLQALQEVYADSTIHDLVMEHALVDAYVPFLKEELVDNTSIFKEAVRKDEPLSLIS